MDQRGADVAEFRRVRHSGIGVTVNQINHEETVMSLLHQGRIIKSLKEHGVEITDEGLKRFLDGKSDGYEPINGVTIRKRGKDVDGAAPSGPHQSRWYDIVSNGFDTNRANEQIVDYILSNGLT